MLINTHDARKSSRDVKLEIGLSGLDCDSSIEDLRRACGEETYQDLFCYARSMVESSDASEDIVQEAFTNTLTAIEKGVQIDNMGGFLYRCVRNLCVNHVSRDPKHSTTEDILLVEEQSAAASAELRYRWQKVEDTVDKLPSSQRNAFLLAEVRGLHYDEIAALMDRSTNSVRQLLNRAREKVRAKADTGWDWGASPVPVVAADSAPESWYNSLSSNISDWIQPKVSELHTWMGNVSQSCTDSVLQNGTSLATGLAIVAVAVVSPAPPAEPPVEQDIHVSAPTVVSVEDPGPIVSRPHSNTTSTQVDKPAPVSTVVASIPKDVVDRPRVVTKERSPTEKSKVAKVAVTVDKDTTEKRERVTYSKPGTGQGGNEAPEELKFKAYTGDPLPRPPEPDPCSEIDPYAEKRAQLAAGNSSSSHQHDGTNSTSTPVTISAGSLGQSDITGQESSDNADDQDDSQPDPPETGGGECIPEMTVQ